MRNRLFYGDNLPVLREHIASESVDLVYLDPPFNSNRSYSVIFGEHVQKDTDANAQIQAFDDTWHWTNETERLYRDILVNSPTALADAMQAFRVLTGESDALAYLVMMAPRLVELHRAGLPQGWVTSDLACPRVGLMEEHGCTGPCSSPHLIRFPSLAGVCRRLEWWGRGCRFVHGSDRLGWGHAIECVRVVAAAPGFARFTTRGGLDRLDRRSIS